MAPTTSEGILYKYKVLLAMILLVLCVENIYSIFPDVTANMATYVEKKPWYGLNGAM